jgi:3-oxoacyl-[acyl-carrier-protein] synthase-3
MRRPVDDLDFPIDEHVRASYAAMRECRRDPFQGSQERRIMSREELPSDMEIRAAEEALQRSGLRRQEVDFVLSYSAVPDYLTEPNAPTVHHGLGLDQRCLSVALDAACNTFLHQLSFATALIGSGQATYGLLVQSSNLSSLMPTEEPYSAWFGDAATAVVVGPVPAGYGVLGQDHRTNGAMKKLLVAGVPGARWHADGTVILYAMDARGALRMILEVGARGREVVHAALAAAGLGADDVQFYASHQATAWFREVTQKSCGLVGARFLDTFADFGSVSAGNIPLQLALAERRGMLEDGDLIAMYSGGSGISWSGAVVRWRS